MLFVVQASCNHCEFEFWHPLCIMRDWGLQVIHLARSSLFDHPTVCVEDIFLKVVRAAIAGYVVARVSNTMPPPTLLLSQGVPLNRLESASPRRWRETALCNPLQASHTANHLKTLKSIVNAGFIKEL
eukprot:158484-Amphidinium_carterae.1